MTGDAVDVSRFEAAAASGAPFSRADVEMVLSSADLLVAGRLGEAARRFVSGDVVTFGRVLVLAGPELPSMPGEAGEVRLTGRPATTDEMAAWATRACALAAGRPLTGFSVADLLACVGGRLDGLSAAARALRAAGLEALAEFPVDVFSTAEDAVGAARAIQGGGLGVWRLTIDRAPFESRLMLIERARAIHDATGDVRAFAPLPRHDGPDQPSTGYDDVRTVAAARLMCPSIGHIQVDWPLYGPKLAQVAVLYGANDIDGVAAIDSTDLGPRRSPLEEIRRQIRDASATAVERNGRYERLS